jgi:purine-nucleoside phosphorylase
MACTEGDDSRRRSLAAAPSGAVAAAERVVAAGGSRGSNGVVLGTGLGELAGRLAAPWSLDAAVTGWLARSTATGHAGRVAGGTVHGRPVVLLQGRVHAYEGFPSETLGRGVELLAALGATTVLLTNAAGGLRPDMQRGELVVVSDHIDLVRRTTAVPAAGVAPFREVYDADLAELAIEATRRAGVAARKGVYAYVLGPSYETRAEYRMLRRAGADVVGMSTVPEAVTARRLGLRVAAVSVVTNVARPDAPDETDAEDVCREAGQAAAGVWAVLEAVAGVAEKAAPTR